MATSPGRLVILFLEISIAGNCQCSSIIQGAVPNFENNWQCRGDSVFPAHAQPLQDYEPLPPLEYKIEKQMEDTLVDELTRVRPIDAEIVSLATSLGTDLRTGTPFSEKAFGSKPATPNDPELVRTEASNVPIPMTFKRFIVLLSLATSFIVATTPIFFITGALSYVVNDIGGETSYAWLAIANSLATAAIAPATGAISDLIGRRYVLLSGSALVITGMIIVGLAGRMDVAISGMAITGVGGAFAELVGSAGISELAPVKSRGTYLGTAFLIVLPFGACSSYAQSYSSSSTWRWGAWISVIFAGINFLMVSIFYHPPPRPNSLGLTKRQTLARIDYFGIVLSIGGFTLFLLGIQWGGAWRSVQVITTMTLGLFLILLFCIWERFAPYPVLPAALFADKRISVLTLIITALSGANFWSLAGFWPYACQQLFGPDANYVARLLIGYGFSVPLGIIFVNWGLSLSRGAIRELFTVSSCIMVAGIGSLANVTQNTPHLGVGLSFLGGLGVGGIIQPAATILTIVSPDELIATATAITLSFRLIGGSIGYAIYFNVLQNKLSDILPRNVGAAVAQAGLPINQIPAFMGAFFTKNSTALGQYAPVLLLAAEDATQVSYVAGFRLIYLVSIAFGGSAVIASLFLGNIRKYMVDRVAVDIR